MNEIVNGLRLTDFVLQIVDYIDSKKQFISSVIKKNFMAFYKIVECDKSIESLWPFFMLYFRSEWIQIRFEALLKCKMRCFAESIPSWIIKSITKSVGEKGAHSQSLLLTVQLMTSYTSRKKNAISYLCFISCWFFSLTSTVYLLSRRWNSLFCCNLCVRCTKND